MSSLSSVPASGADPPYVGDSFDRDKDAQLADLNFAALHCFPKLGQPPYFGDKLRNELEPIGAAIRLATGYCQTTKVNRLLRKLNGCFANDVESVVVSCRLQADMNWAIQLAPRQIFFYKSDIVEEDEILQVAVWAICRDAIYPSYLTADEREMYRAERCPAYNDRATRYRFGHDFADVILGRASRAVPPQNVIGMMRDVARRLKEDLRAY